MPQTRTNKFIRRALCVLFLAPFSISSFAQTLALAEPSTLDEATAAISYNVPHLVFEKNLQPISYSENDSRRALNALKHDALIQHAALRSEIAFVQDLESSTVLYQKNSDAVRPIASISKLMTALVVAESGLLDSFEIVEVNPILDRENTTALTAVELTDRVRSTTATASGVRAACAATSSWAQRSTGASA